MNSLGWVVGGAESVVRAMLDAVGPQGTLCAVLSWEDMPIHLSEWPEEWRRAYEEEMPPFDPKLSSAHLAHGRFPERLRTWPGVRRSGHPDQGVAAVGPLAEWLTKEHPLDDGFGADTPFSRLAERGGQVLMLGAPLKSLTLLHHAEAIAAVPSKRTWSYRLPIADTMGVRWREFHDIQAERGPFPYDQVVADGEEPLAAIARAALEAGVGTSGAVAEARCHLFDARELVDFATEWLEAHFAGQSPVAAASSRPGAIPADVD